MVRQQHRKPRRTNRQEQHSGPPRRKLALALQGGGSHGAFTWGVLDRLLDDATIDIIGVTGTSAAAISGAILVDGLVGGGPSQARAKLRQYWEAVGVTPGFGSFFSGRTCFQEKTSAIFCTKKIFVSYNELQRVTSCFRPVNLGIQTDAHAGPKTD
jgi:predicted acylesterase/phospholipase RssA